LNTRQWNSLFRKIAPLFFLASLLSLQSACSSGKDKAAEASSPASSPSAANFGDELALASYSTQNKDGHTEVELQWKALHKPAADYVIFVHALDASGNIVFQMDHPLKNAAGAPTTAWAAGDSVSDRFPAVPPSNRPVGTYTLRIGAFVLAPARFLQVFQSTLPQPQDGWNNHSVLIQNVECK
jgi:hypothetical protein